MVNFDVMKKALAIIFIVLGIFLSFILVLRIPAMVTQLATRWSENGYSPETGYTIGYLIGQLIAFFLLAGIAYLLFRYGLKWLKQPFVQPSDLLDEDFRSKC
jgi:hypothetical protein